MYFFKISIFIFGLVFFGLPAEVPINLLAQEAGEATFVRDVWPILEARCVTCHNADRAEGDLRFDAGREAVVEGGHTGRAILGTSSQDSELIRRINSTEIGYQMPKEGPRLTDSQIAALTRWVDAGALWGKTQQIVPEASGPKDDDAPPATLAERVVWFGKQMEQPGFRGLFYLSVAFLLTMAVMLFAWRMSSSNATWLSRLKTLAIVFLAFFCVATYIHYDAKQKDTAKQLYEVQKKLLNYSGPPEFLHSLSAPHPMHPPRLGGVYYRGNDERDPRLFNGGFYRTAQLEVWLTNQEGRRLKRGDSAAGELFIDFEIKRAPNTTGELFSDAIMSVIGLTDEFSLSENPDDGATVGEVTPMQTVEPDQSWRCRYRIGDLKGRNSAGGKFFVVQNTFRPKAHYAIEFEIVLNEADEIAEDSQLWMGSLYNLNGRVFVPYDDQKILLDRWFDWRPIPEITGEQTDDPQLLGIPEHR